MLCSNLSYSVEIEIWCIAWMCGYFVLTLRCASTKLDYHIVGRELEVWQLSFATDRLKATNNLHQSGDFGPSSQILNSCQYFWLYGVYIIILLIDLFEAGEKDKEDNMVDALGPEDATSMKNEELNSLKTELAVRDIAKQLDGFGYYL